MRCGRERTSLNVTHSNTDWCNIAGEASDMQGRGKFGTIVPNTDWCNIAGEAGDMQGKREVWKFQRSIASIACDMQERGKFG